MKNAAGPYEFFHWKSSCGRLVVRTTWVKGVRHAVLSDNDDDDDVDKHTPPSKKERQKRGPQRGDSENAAAAAETATADNDRPPSNDAMEADDDYVERVLRWLHKPSGVMLKTCRKPISAPSGDNGACCSRRLALVNTCSIPGNKAERQQVVEINKRPTMMTRSANVAVNNCTKNRYKTELHVHMPSIC